MVGMHSSNLSTAAGTILNDLTAVKQPDESFFQAGTQTAEICSACQEQTGLNMFEEISEISQVGAQLRLEAIVLNSEFCDSYSDYTLHWTDKDSMREVRSVTSEYNIMSPGVLIFPRVSWPKRQKPQRTFCTG